MNAPEPAGPPVSAEQDLGFDLPGPASISKTAVALRSLGIAAVLGVAFVAAYLPRRHERAELAAATAVADHASTRVEVVRPKTGSSERAVILPGSVQALQETVLYARASGFVRRWLVDLGDHAQEGQLLAELETPELDQELAQAEAQRAQARQSVLQTKANRELARANLKRFETLAPAGVATQAELDQGRAQAAADDATVSSAEATVAAQDANIRRLSQLKAFSQVTAPFAGTITQRWVEVGALVTAGNGQPLYRIAAMDPARVFVQVPQDVAPGVRTGIGAKVNVREYGGRVFEGRVAHVAGELDAATRTMNTEIRVPNGDGALIAGMYAEVSLTLPTPHRVFVLPATSLLIDASGPHVAVVSEASRIHLVPVVVERDTGGSVEISSGLRGDERVTRFGSGDFVEDKLVEVTPEQPESAPNGH